MQMKMKIYRIGLTGFLILMLTSTGCKKEEETPQFATLSFESEQVLEKLPSGLKNSSDPYAQECVDMIESAVDMSDFIGQMEVPPEAQKTSKKASVDTWYWTWNYMGEIWTFYWTYEEDNSKKYWSMEIQYGSGNRYKYIDAWEMKDGSAGEVSYNFNWTTAYYGDLGYSDLFWTYNWEINSAGDYDFSWYYESPETDCSYYMHYDIHLNDDGSGSIEYYFFDELFYQMEWDSAGNGSWIYTYGGENASGSWVAG